MTNGVTVDEVFFDVTIPSETLLFEGTPPVPAVVRGYRYRPAVAPSCGHSVPSPAARRLPGRYAWDLPLHSYPILGGPPSRVGHRETLSPRNPRPAQ